VFELENYLQQITPEIANEVTSIVMNNEREVLHNWETKHIYVKNKNQTISQYVSETILTLRWFLVNKIIEELKSEITSEPETDNSETLSMVIDYLGLTNIFSKKLGRVISRHN
jgi:DNA primase